MYDDGPFNGLVGDETSAEALSRKSPTAGSVCSADHAKQLGEEWNWCWKCGEALNNKPNV